MLKTNCISRWLCTKVNDEMCRKYQVFMCDKNGVPLYQLNPTSLYGFFSTAYFHKHFQGCQEHFKAIERYREGQCPRKNDAGTNYRGGIFRRRATFRQLGNKGPLCYPIPFVSLLAVMFIVKRFYLQCTLISTFVVSLPALFDAVQT